MLVAHDPSGTRVVSWEATKGPSYACPECSASVVFKQGPIIIPHFAHRPSEACGYGEGESYRHEYMKYYISRFWEHVELEIPLIPGRRADCVLSLPDGRPLVIECQASELSVEEFRSRTKDYTSRGIPVLWVWYSTLFTEHHPPKEWRVRAAVLEDAARRNESVIVFRWTENGGALESWRLVVPYRDPVYIRRVYAKRIVADGDQIPLPRVWKDTLFLPEGKPISLPSSASDPLDNHKMVGLEQIGIPPFTSRGQHISSAWRVIGLDGEPLYLGLFVSVNAAAEWLLDHDYSLVQGHPGHPGQAGQEKERNGKSESGTGIPAVSERGDPDNADIPVPLNQADRILGEVF